MISRENNFDLIRLLAAIQVVFEHGFFHLKIDGKLLTNFNRIFPGVLIFFTVSGFLIFSSFDRNNDLKKYFVNRFLRIYPALWLCFIITVILLIIFKIVNLSNIFSLTMLKWYFTQVTFFQFWTPDLLRAWGIGTPNGSLWTIPVEIQFYILLPIVVLLFKKIKLIYKFIALSIISIFVNLYLKNFIGPNESIIVKLGTVSVLPYLYCFLAGSLMYLYWDKIKVVIEGKALYWTIIFFAYWFLTGNAPSYFPQYDQLVSNFLLSILTISIAFTFPGFGNFLKGNDISYGIYIYHALVLNSLVALGHVGEIKYFVIFFLVTILMSCFSWFFVEKRALMLKSLYNKR